MAISPSARMVALRGAGVGVGVGAAVGAGIAVASAMGARVASTAVRCASSPPPSNATRRDNRRNDDNQRAQDAQSHRRDAIGTDSQTLLTLRHFRLPSKIIRAETLAFTVTIIS